jgi:hypothetical protein
MRYHPCRVYLAAHDDALKSSMPTRDTTTRTAGLLERRSIAARIAGCSIENSKRLGPYIPHVEDTIWREFRR